MNVCQFVGIVEVEVAIFFKIEGKLFVFGLVGGVIVIMEVAVYFKVEEDMVVIVYFCEKVFVLVVGFGEGVACQFFGESWLIDFFEDVVCINQVDCFNFLVESYLVEVVFFGVDFW